jgi:hypothetical protein
MADGPLVGLERRFFENRGVERSPAGILAVGDQSVAGSEHAAVGLSRGENRVGWNDQKNTPDVGRRWFLLYITLRRGTSYLVENPVRQVTLDLREAASSRFVLMS